MIPIHSDKVEQFAKKVLANQGASETSSSEEKAKAIFDFVSKKIGTFERRSINVGKIDDFVREIEANGGVTGNHRINGDCKSFTVFYGGLAMALGLKVRPVVGVMESTPSLFNTLGHAWIEVKLDDRWIFVDPILGFFDNKDKIGLPANLQYLYVSFDPKKTYELEPSWGGPLTANAYEGGITFVDLIAEYKYTTSTTPVPTTVVLFTQSPVNLLLYDEDDKLIDRGLSYGYVWPESNASTISNPEPEGQFIVLINLEMPLRYKVKLIGTDMGNYSFYAVYFSATNFSTSSINGTVVSGQEILFQLSSSEEGEIRLSTPKMQEGINVMFVLGMVLVACVAFTTTYLVLRRKRLFKNKKLNLLQWRQPRESYSY